MDTDVAEHFCWAVDESVVNWSCVGALDDVLSVYIGGGTPTILGEGLRAMIDGLRTRAGLDDTIELTVETNPDTTDALAASRLTESGVNRFSLGVQSFDDRVLASLGRRHDGARARRALADLIATESRVSVDLMCGVPGQDCASWLQTLECAIDSGVGHVSVYPLTVEGSTPLAARIAEKPGDAPDSDLAAEMMEIAQEMLEEAGFEHYEIANYARAGEESVHNCGYWTGRPFLGIGPSAASMIPASEFSAWVSRECWDKPGVAGVGRTIEPAPVGAVRVRFRRSADTEDFLRNPVGPPVNVEYATAYQAAAEDAILGLRLTEGIDEDLADAAGASATLGELASRGLVEHEGGRWKISQAGWLIGNEVFGAVWNAAVRRGLA